MDWICPKCKRREAVRTSVVLEVGVEIGLGCNGCGVVLTLKVEHDKNSGHYHTWGIPKEKPRK